MLKEGPSPYRSEGAPYNRTKNPQGAIRNNTRNDSRIGGGEMICTGYKIKKSLKDAKRGGAVVFQGARQNRKPQLRLH